MDTQHTSGEILGGGSNGRMAPSHPPGGPNTDYSRHYGSTPSAPPEKGLDFMTLLRMVLRRWVTVLLLTLMGGLCGILYIQLVTPVYKVKADLEMSVRQPQVIDNPAVFDDGNLVRDADAIFNTRFNKFKSPAMERLAAAAYMEQYPDQLRTKGGTVIGQHSLARCIRQVSWSRDRKSYVVYVTYESSDPEFAANLVNILSHCAGVLMMQENQAQADNAVKWLMSQVEEKRIALDAVETELAKLREELQLDSLQQQKTAAGQSLVSVSQEKEVIISQLASRKTVYEFVVGLQDTDPNLEMLPTGLPKEEQLNELIRIWRSTNDELLLAMDRFTELHPRYKEAAEKESRARARLEQFIDLSSKAVLNEIKLLEKQRDQVDERINIIKNEAIDLEQHLAAGMGRVRGLERKRDAADNAYQAILKRVEEARLSADENMAFTEIYRSATVPKVPIRPRKVRVLILSVFLGGIIGSALVIVTALWSDKIAAVGDLRALNLNILGTIPTQKKVDSRGELATIGLRDRFNHIVEIFAGINALVSSDKYSDRTQVMLMSSVLPGEGKSISACNLAISSALNGARTLLIDGDLRKPQLVNIFNTDEGHPSLLNWLSSGEDTLSHDQLVAKDIIENLDLITSRPLKEINPAELLGRDRLAELLRWARENYDRVIIDSPPLGAVGDAQMLANHADCIILVSRIGKTRRRALKYALARFHETDAYVLGCIANDVPHSLAGLFGGADGYGYGYGHGGGYRSYGRDDG